MQQILEMFISLGLPSAVIAMVLIALLFKRDHPPISAWAGWSAIGLVAVIGIAQLVAIVRGKIDIEIDPAAVFAFDKQGRPVDLEVTVKRAGTTLETTTIGKIDDSEYADRNLTLNAQDEWLSVIFHDQQVGRLTREKLGDVGWHPASDCSGPDAGEPQFWSTNRVHVGQEHKLGKTRYGILKLVAKRFTGDGKAVVTLDLEGGKEPLPKQLEIANKGLGVQSFSEVPEFYVAVREADFTVDPPWAAFSVFSLQ